MREAHTLFILYTQTILHCTHTFVILYTYICYTLHIDYTVLYTYICHIMKYTKDTQYVQIQNTYYIILYIYKHTRYVPTDVHTYIHTYNGTYRTHGYTES